MSDTDESNSPETPIPRKRDPKLTSFLGKLERKAKEEAAEADLVKQEAVNQDDYTDDEYNAAFRLELLDLHVYTLRRLRAAGSLSSHELLDILCPYASGLDIIPEDHIPLILVNLQEMIWVTNRLLNCAASENVANDGSTLSSSLALWEEFRTFELEGYRNAYFAAHMKDLFNIAYVVWSNIDRIKYTDDQLLESELELLPEHTTAALALTLEGFLDSPFPLINITPDMAKAARWRVPDISEGYGDIFRQPAFIKKDVG